MSRRGAYLAAVLAIAMLGLAAAASDTGRAQFDPTAGPVVEVEERGPNGGWHPCSRVDDGRRPVEGGCELTAEALMVFKINTPFGRTALPDCGFDWNVHVSSTGAVVVEIDMVGHLACGEVVICKAGTDATARPWIGQIEPAGSGFKLVLDACVDTCAGWFEGPLELPIREGGGGWVVRASRAPFGESGIEVNGSWRFEGGDLRLRRVAPATGG